MSRWWSYGWRSLMFCMGAIWFVYGCVSLAYSDWLHGAWLVAVGLGALVLYGDGLRRLGRKASNVDTKPSP